MGIAKELYRVTRLGGCIVCFMDCECGSVQAVKEHGNRKLHGLYCAGLLYVLHL